jgi:plastocyanin
MTVRRGLQGGARTLALAIALVVLAACSSTSLDDVEPVTGVTDVEMSGTKYEPRVIEVAAGTTVTWHFSGVAHDVKGDGWGSDVMSDGEFAHAFESTGTFDYHCTLHRGMTGRVIVAGG